VIHYPQAGGSANGGPVYKTLPNGRYDSVVGQLTSISTGDLAQLRDMYQCGSSSSPSPAAPAPTPSTPGCSDSSSYRDPEFGSSCDEWRGYACQPTEGYAKDYTQELSCACPAACNACSSLASCPSSSQSPAPSGCRDSSSYIDPEFNSDCAAWTGYACAPSAGWAGTNYGAELKSQCPKACRQCGR